MDKRKITNLKNLEFKPFDKLFFIANGTYISKLEPGTKTIKHIHEGYEEFLILDGEN